MDLVDIATWKADDIFSPYPEGSRDKYALIAPLEGCPRGIIPGHRYLLKFSNQRYPVQFWSEIMATKVAKYVGVPAPPAFVAVDPVSGRPGSLIEWFYGPRLENLAPRKRSGFNLVATLRLIAGLKAEEIPKTHSLYVPGSNYMRRIIPEYDLRGGKQHNLLDVGIWIQVLGRLGGEDFWPYWAKVLVFDVLIGNTDRHQDNWGVLWRTDAANNPVPRFAPAFDNGTSLAHEIMETRLVNFSADSAIDRYVRKGRHHMKWQRDDEKQAQHFDLIERLMRSRSRLRPVIAGTMNIDLQALYRELEAVGDIDSPVLLSKDRLNVVCRMIERRVEILKEILEQ